MVDYKVVKFCRFCTKRFVVEKGQNRAIYCDSCQKKVNAARKDSD